MAEALQPRERPCWWAPALPFPHCAHRSTILGSKSPLQVCVSHKFKAAIHPTSGGPEGTRHGPKGARGGPQGTRGGPPSLLQPLTDGLRCNQNQGGVHHREVRIQQHLVSEISHKASMPVAPVTLPGIRPTTAIHGPHPHLLSPFHPHRPPTAPSRSVRWCGPPSLSRSMTVFWALWCCPCHPTILSLMC